MAQHDYVIANGTGAAVRSDLNNGLAAIVSQNSGATAPATTYAYMTWADTTAGVMKMRNGANNAWITLYQLDGEWSTIAFENGSAAAPSIYFKDSGTDTGIYSPGTDQVGITTGGTVRLTTTTTGITSALPVDVPLGAAATPSITFTGDTNTGIYSPGADQLAISTGGTQRINIEADGDINIDSGGVFYDATNNRLGIGTSSPSQQLHIASANTSTSGTIFTSDSGGRGVLITSPYIGNAVGKIGISGTDAALALGSGSSNTTALYIDTSQRVGIGTTSPVDPLHVIGSSSGGLFEGSVQGVVTVKKTGTNGVSLISPAAGVLQIYDNNGSAERARIDSSGRLLVGTSTSASGAGQGTGTIVQANGSFYAYEGTNTGGHGGAIAFGTNSNNTFSPMAQIKGSLTNSPGTEQQGDLLFFTRPTGSAGQALTERMRISNGGNLLVNRTAQTAGERFAVYTDVTSSNTAYFWYGQTDDRANVICRHDRSIGGNVGVQIAFLNQTGSNVGQISSTGSATTYTTSSDYRLKENVVPLTNAINRFNQLQVYRFNFIADSETVVDGFIAHEVQSIVPEAIVGEKDAVNQDGSMKPQGIDQSKLVPLLTAALQEAVAEIKALKDRVTALEGA